MLAQLSSGSYFQANTRGWNPRIPGANGWKPWIPGGLIYTNFFGAQRAPGMPQAFNLGADANDGTVIGAPTINLNSIVLGGASLTSAGYTQTPVQATSDMTIWWVGKSISSNADHFSTYGLNNYPDPIGGNVFLQGTRLYTNNGVMYWLPGFYDPTTGLGTKGAYVGIAVASSSTTAAGYAYFSAVCATVNGTTGLITLKDWTRNVSSSNTNAVSSTLVRDLRGSLTFKMGATLGASLGPGISESALILAYNRVQSALEQAQIYASIQAYCARRAALGVV